MCIVLGTQLASSFMDKGRHSVTKQVNKYQRNGLITAKFEKLNTPIQEYTSWYNPNKTILVPWFMVHDANVFRLDFIAAKFRMIFLGSKVSGHQNLLPLATRQQHTLVTLPTFFSVTKLLSPEATSHGKIHRFFKILLGPPLTLRSLEGPWARAQLAHG